MNLFAPNEQLDVIWYLMCQVLPTDRGDHAVRTVTVPGKGRIEIIAS